MTCCRCYVTDERLTTLIIDLDGTLIDGQGWHETLDALDRLATELADVAPGAAITAIRDRLAAAWEEESIAEDFRRLGFAMSDALWSSFGGPGTPLARIRDWASGFRLRFWSDVARSAGIADVVSEERLAARYAKERSARIRAFPGASSTLKHLRGRFRTVLLSNGPADLQRLKLERTGLGAGFDAIVISGETGCAKPDARAFRLALAAAGCSATEAVMVGDDWTNDVLGALAVGVNAVFIDAGRCAARGFHSPAHVAVLERFADLLAWIDRDISETHKT
jgi:putative hydrolase of the HAD superfamily